MSNSACVAKQIICLLELTPRCLYASAADVPEEIV